MKFSGETIGCSLVAAVETAEELAARGVVEVVAVERQPFHQLKAALGPFGHRHGDGPVQLHDGRRCVTLELGVEEGDLRPVGLRLGVERGDRRLQLVRAWPSQRECAVERGLSRRDLVFVPEPAVLVLEQDELVVSHTGVAP
jgi:hypothetical protein